MLSCPFPTTITITPQAPQERERERERESLYNDESSFTILANEHAIGS